MYIGLHSKSGDKQDQTVPAGTGVGAKIKNSGTAYIHANAPELYDVVFSKLEKCPGVFRLAPQGGGLDGLGSKPHPVLP